MAIRLRGSAVELDDLLRRYFGATDLSRIAPAAIPAAAERMAVDLALERDRGRRFALWVLMHMLGVAPDVDTTFADAGDREAARNFIDLADGDGS